LSSESSSKGLPRAIETGASVGDPWAPVRLPVGSAINRCKWPVSTWSDQGNDGEGITCEWAAGGGEVRWNALGHWSDHHRDIASVSCRSVYTTLLSI